MTNKYIYKTIYNIDNKVIFPDINSSADVWNFSDDKIDKEELLRSDHTESYHTDYLKNLLYQIFG